MSRKQKFHEKSNIYGTRVPLPDPRTEILSVEINRDPDRVARARTDASNPCPLMFAGWSHPSNTRGKKSHHGCFQRIRDDDPMMGWDDPMWASVYDAGPASTQYWINVSCSLG